MANAIEPEEALTAQTVWGDRDATPRTRAAKTGRERIQEDLRDRILSGVLAPGSRLDLDAVAKEYGTSRTPVREACLGLGQEGLVRVAPRSGIQVIGITPEAILENFAIMAALCGVAAQWAADRITPRQLLRIRELNREIKVAAQSGDDIVTLNWEFHREINRSCASERLQEMLRDAVKMIPHTFLQLFPEHVVCSLDEHDALVKALANHDGVAARRITEEHFESAAAVVAAQLRRQDSALTP